MSIYYIETTIPSFYHEVRSEPSMVARRDWTRRWFDVAVTSDRIVSSVAVLDELRRGDFPGRDECLAMLDTIEMLELDDPVFEIVEAYLANKLMPSDPFGDPLHLALASYHRCDFLVTWNCLHLANANKFGQIRRINGILGLYTPELVTPMELLGGNVGP
ncbi:MAG: type II toxin-antitoxin system VapC family toxin [Planctomycetes bacterium]|nr:type II toxin-antitoxin system VapC family toxin [Planctomycetota bacterium]